MTRRFADSEDPGQYSAKRQKTQTAEDDDTEMRAFGPDIVTSPDHPVESEDDNWEMRSEQTNNAVQSEDDDLEMRLEEPNDPLETDVDLERFEGLLSEFLTDEIDERLGENPFEPDSKVAINDFDKELIDDFNPDTFSDGLDLSLPPLSDLNEIFVDMTHNALEMLSGLNLAVKHLQGRPLRVATMCSGTESPIIALKIIFECLSKELHLEQPLTIKHLFSAEIVPFKQAFIELNFAPELLFRDIIEMTESKDGKATTAFGARKAIPSDIDCLVAGFSCVDMSGLNRHKLTLQDQGESGDTLMAIVRFAAKYRPKVVVLENLLSTPWEPKDSTLSVSEMWLEVGYYCQYVNLDTKAFYIPHTRVRGYMICVHFEGMPKNPFGNGPEPEDFREGFDSGEARQIFKTIAPKKKVFAKEIALISRQASEPVEAFLLPEKDMRVVRVVNSQAPASTKTVNWVTCEASHDTARRVISLGKGRPLTKWTAGGSCCPHDSLSQYWILGAVDRVKDSIDIQWLRNLRRGFDSIFKNRIIDLSQNIDRRSKDNQNSGLTGCVTPNGMPWSSCLGRVLIAEEALKLQGMDPDNVNVSLLSQAELRDLAGNAMSCPVVGAVLMVALSLAHEAIPRHLDSEIIEGRGAIDVISKELDIDGCKHDIVFGAYVSPVSPAIFDAVAKGVIHCTCEGQFEVFNSQLVECEVCGHKACIKHAVNPIHQYKIVHPVRVNPGTVVHSLREALPVTLSFEFQDIPDVLAQLGSWWEVFKQFHIETRQKVRSVKLKSLAKDRPKTGQQSLFSFFAKPNAKPHWEPPTSADWLILNNILSKLKESEAHFSEIDRNAKSFKALYESHDSAPGSFKVEVDVSSAGFECKVWAKPPKSQPVDSALRQLLQYPIARMRSEKKNLDLMHGTWQLRVPTIHEFDISIRGTGKCIPCFEALQGIVSFQSVTIWSKLRIDVVGKSKVVNGHAIGGEYILHQNCSTPMGVLYKKTSEPPIYLVFNPTRYGHPDKDQFVFTTELSRLRFREIRDPIARVDKNWRPNSGHRDHSIDPPPPGNRKNLYFLRENFNYQSTNPNEEVVTRCFVLGSWCDIKALMTTKSGGTYNCISQVQKLGSVFFQEPQGQPASCFESFLQNIPGPSCYESVEALSIKVSVSNLALEDTIWCTVPAKEVSKLLVKCSFLKGRIPMIQDDQWYPVTILFQGCNVCAAAAPAIKWKLLPRNWKPTEIQKAKRSHGKSIPTLSDKEEDKALVPFEDPEAAINYERALKARPSPFLVMYEMSEGTELHLKIGINVKTLVHRAATSLPVRAGDRNMQLSYRFTSKCDPLEKAKLGPFVLGDCQDLTPAEKPPNFVLPLFDHQARSLAWMIGQEDPGVRFDEVRIAEATLDELNWRVEGRACQEIKIRSGVLADQVGYGKTALVLGLFDTQYQKQPKLERLVKATDGKIDLHATLILVPNHLVPQWKTEARKFLGNMYKVVSIQTLGQWDSTSIHEFVEADIVIFSWELLKADGYFERVADLSAMLPFPNKSENLRAEKAWYAGARDALSRFTHCFLSDDDSNIWNDLAELFTQNWEDSENNNSYNPSFRLRGAARRKFKEAVGQADAQPQSGEDSILDPADATILDREQIKNECVQRYRKSYGHILSRGDFKGPPLELFHFHRKVVDEYTYVPDLQKDMVAQIGSVCSWYLSGTPGLQDFSDVWALMKLLGADLGQPVLTPGIITPQNIKRLSSQQTQSEKFRELLLAPSFAWSKDRHEYAQLAIKKFVRHNKTPIVKVNTYHHIRPVQLPIIDRAVYEEFSYTVAASDMRERKPQKFYEKLDRERRLIDIWKFKGPGEKLNAVEALMKFNMAFSNLELGDLCKKRYDNIMKTKAELQKLLHKSRSILVKAATNPKKENEDQKYFDRFENRIKCNDLGDRDVSRYILRVIGACRANLSRDQLTSNPGTHRALSNKLNDLCKALVAAVRGYRFLLSVKLLRSGDTTTEATPNWLKGCISPADMTAEDELDILDPQGLFSDDFETDTAPITHAPHAVFAQCGHMYCEPCLTQFAEEKSAPVCKRKYCEAPAATPYPYPLTMEECQSAPDLGGRNAKLMKIVDLIKHIPKKEQILLFTQFSDQLDTIKGYLTKKRVSFAVLEGTAEAKVGGLLDAFRGDYLEGSHKGKQVLLLSIDNVSAAGSNLTCANHVIFVFPYLASSQVKYDSAMTQAIGRVCRHGQEKPVHIYHFLTLNTADVDVFEARKGSILVCDDDLNLYPSEVYDDDKLDSGEFDHKKYKPKIADWEPSFFRMIPYNRFPENRNGINIKTTGRYSSHIHKKVVRCMDASFDMDEEEVEGDEGDGQVDVAYHMGQDDA